MKGLRSIFSLCDLMKLFKYILFKYRYLNGKRKCSTFIYEYLKYPNYLVTQINLIWMPIINTEVANRCILIWIHPSAFEEALTTLEFAREQIKLQDGKGI